MPPSKFIYETVEHKKLFDILKKKITVQSVMKN